MANNPNNTDSWRRRAPQERELDNDGNNNRAADADYQRNLKRIPTDDQAAEPTRDKSPPSRR